MSTLRESDFVGLERVGIPREWTVLAEIERVTDSEARRNFGIVGSGDMSGLLFPYFNPQTCRRVSARLRRDNPEVIDGKVKRKYVCPFGDRRHVYFPPGAIEVLEDNAVPIILVEAEKSALALMAWASRVRRKYLPIAMGAVTDGVDGSGRNRMPTESTSMNMAFSPICSAPRTDVPSS
jgi:hypothetical protein